MYIRENIDINHVICIGKFFSELFLKSPNSEQIIHISTFSNTLVSTTPPPHEHTHLYMYK